MPQGDLDRPFLDHGKIVTLAGFIFHAGDDMLHGIGPLAGHVLYLGPAYEVEGYKNPVSEDAFGHGPEYIPGLHAIPLFHKGCEIPFRLAAETLQIDPPLKEEATLGSQFGKRILQTVIDLA